MEIGAWRCGYPVAAGLGIQSMHPSPLELESNHDAIAMQSKPQRKRHGVCVPDPRPILPIDEESLPGPHTLPSPAVGPVTPVHVYKPDSTTAVRDGLGWVGRVLARPPATRSVVAPQPLTSKPSNFGSTGQRDSTWEEQVATGLCGRRQGEDRGRARAAVCGGGGAGRQPGWSAISRGGVWGQ
jgi:hypothetical protein